MDPLDLITKDHRAVETLFIEYEGHGNEAYEHKRETAAKIIELLESHAEMEEMVAYPRFLDAFSKEEDKKVEQAFAEHEVAKILMDELKGLPPEDPQFDAKIMVLKESVAHHVEEEETILLPKAQEHLSEGELAELGEALAAFKGEREA